MTSLQVENLSDDISQTFLNEDYDLVKRIQNFEVRSYTYQARVDIHFKEGLVQTDFSFKKDQPYLECGEEIPIFSYEPKMTFVGIEMGSQVQGAFGNAIYQFDIAVFQNSKNVGTLSFKRRIPISLEALAWIKIDDSLTVIEEIIEI